MKRLAERLDPRKVWKYVYIYMFFWGVGGCVYFFFFGGVQVQVQSFFLEHHLVGVWEVLVLSFLEGREGVLICLGSLNCKHEIYNKSPRYIYIYSYIRYKSS